MIKSMILRKPAALLVLILSLIILSGGVLAEKRPLTFVDVMKFKQIRDLVLSEDGRWAAYSLQPDRGDGEAVLRDLKTGKDIVVERGARPALSKDGRWACLAVNPRAVDVEKAKKDKPKPGMALVDLASGQRVSFDGVEKYAFADDSGWLAFLLFKEEKKEEPKKEGEEKKDSKPEKGSPLVLRNLASGLETKLERVLSFSFDPTGRFLAYDRIDPDGKENALYVKDLKKDGFPEVAVIKTEKANFSNLSWTKAGDRLAFLSGTLDAKDNTGLHTLWVWSSKTGKVLKAVAEESVPKGWGISEKNELDWSKDGGRLFFGLKPLEFFEPVESEEEKKETEEGDIDLFDLEKILEKREVDVWHWNDPLIVTQQKNLWPRLKDQTYRAVYHQDTGKMIMLADRDMPAVDAPDNAFSALGLSNVPYLKDITWDGFFQDVYHVSLRDGSRKKVASRISSWPSLSPLGRFILYFNERHWHLYDGRTGATRNLTASLDVPFQDEDHDTPDDPPGYGIAGWLEDESAVLIYDKFDVWQFPTHKGEPSLLTGGEGRKTGWIFRVLTLDPEERSFKKGQSLLLSMVHDREKHHGFSTARVGEKGVKRLLEEKKKFVFKAKAKKADVLIFTRESFEEYPDLWATDLTFGSPEKISDANPQIHDFAWGKAELVEWQSLDGLPLQGVLIKPAGYEEGKKYPVLVYYYELSSQRLYEFNKVVVNHRPCFPVYASRGYALFLPDVRFEVGRPGFSALKCVVPGVQKLVDMGVADPKAVALHGHSWSGYETAFIITQTDFFACAIAGAPVSNMTSAYSGIRWESGMARQFQYEKQQSRIGGSLWEYPERYIANSPVFFADQIHTPLLIMHGDEDGAVPWYQAIELYLALRRLGKDCVFLQYRGEPHHPQKYANKLDYSIRMMEYLDHYCQGKPAPEWMTKGVPYRGK